MLCRESAEPQIALRPLLAGQEVVEDYGTTGLTLRTHPVAFLRPDLTARRIRSCAEILRAKDGAWLTIAGLVLLPQRPGSASGVLFITIEDETGHSLVVWPKIFENRLILSASMIATKGRVQREGKVIHFVTQEFFDLSSLLGTVGDRSGPSKTLGHKSRDIDIPELCCASGTKVPVRDFR
jgi:error-prone DNA polymerase